MSGTNWNAVNMPAVDGKVVHQSEPSAAMGGESVSLDGQVNQSELFATSTIESTPLGGQRKRKAQDEEELVDERNDSTPTPNVRQIKKPKKANAGIPEFSRRIGAIFVQNNLKTPKNQQTTKKPKENGKTSGQTTATYSNAGDIAMAEAPAVPSISNRGTPTRSNSPKKSAKKGAAKVSLTGGRGLTPKLASTYAKKTRKVLWDWVGERCAPSANPFGDWEKPSPKSFKVADLAQWLEENDRVHHQKENVKERGPEVYGQIKEHWTSKDLQKFVDRLDGVRNEDEEGEMDVAGDEEAEEDNDYYNGIPKKTEDGEIKPDYMEALMALDTDDEDAGVADTDTPSPPVVKESIENIAPVEDTVITVHAPPSELDDLFEDGKTAVDEGSIVHDDEGYDTKPEPSPTSLKRKVAGEDNSREEERPLKRSRSVAQRESNLQPEPAVGSWSPASSISGERTSPLEIADSEDDDESTGFPHEEVEAKYNAMTPEEVRDIVAEVYSNAAMSPEDWQKEVDEGRRTHDEAKYLQRIYSSKDLLVSRAVTTEQAWYNTEQRLRDMTYHELRAHVAEMRPDAMRSWDEWQQDADAERITQNQADHLKVMFGTKNGLFHRAMSDAKNNEAYPRKLFYPKIVAARDIKGLTVK